MALDVRVNGDRINFETVNEYGGMTHYSVHPDSQRETVLLVIHSGSVSATLQLPADACRALGAHLTLLADLLEVKVSA